VGAQPAAAEHLDEGNGPPLLFLHHFGGSSRSWRGVIDRLSHRHRCIAPDLPGFGTAADRPGPFTTAAAADVITALIEALALQDYRIVGHSMGGKIALAVAARAPPGLRGLILLAPSPPTPEPIPAADRGHLLASWGDRDATAAIVDKISVRALSRLDREQQIADMLASSQEAWAAWLNRGSREDLSAALGRIAVPITIVSGSGDRTVGTAVLHRELLQKTPSATLEIISGAGHLLPIEARDEVAAIIRRSSRAPALAGMHNSQNRGGAG
jgi:pimeloyl-ACP methyl ester carboxylesterase